MTGKWDAETCGVMLCSNATEQLWSTNGTVAM